MTRGAIRARAMPPRAILPAAFALLLAGCGGAVHVTVVNDSGVRLDSLVVQGERTRRACAALAPGDSVRVEFPGGGDDAIAIRGRAAGRRIVQAAGAYVEDGWRLRAAVDAAGIVHVTETAAAY